MKQNEGMPLLDLLDPPAPPEPPVQDPPPAPPAPPEPPKPEREEKKPPRKKKKPLWIVLLAAVVCIGVFIGAAVFLSGGGGDLPREWLGNVLMADSITYESTQISEQIEAAKVHTVLGSRITREEIREPKTVWTFAASICSEICVLS